MGHAYNPCSLDPKATDFAKWFMLDVTGTSWTDIRNPFSATLAEPSLVVHGPGNCEEDRVNDPLCAVTAYDAKANFSLANLTLCGVT